MAHSHADPAAPARPVPKRIRTALLIAVVACAVAVVAGLVALWPHDVQRHLDPSLVTASKGAATTASARIDSVAPASCRGVSGSTQATVNSRDCGTLSITLLEGPSAGTTGSVTIPKTAMALQPHAGQKVVVGVIAVPGQPDRYQFVDFQRGWALAALAVAFVVVLAAVARWRGIAAVVGLFLAGFLLLEFVFPALVAGENALVVGMVGATAIMIVVIYTAHGVSARSTTALLGTIGGILVCGLLSVLFTRVTMLTGVASDDDTLLAASAPNLNLSAALMCAIMIAGLGVLNDVTITQASAVWELADGDYDARTLYGKAMRIGRDHIASTVYTIAFATAGASLTTFLLIVAYQRPLGQLLTAEVFAEEIVRTLVGSIGLVLAVPLTTALGVAIVRAADRAETAPARSREA